MKLGLIKNKKFHQGYFKPKYPKKCVSQLPIIYRSGIELKFMQFCDSNSNITKWGSENVIVEYFDVITKRQRKYYVDNFVMIKEGDNIKKYLIEIKPLNQTIKPKDTGKRKKAHLLFEQCQWETNQCKWHTAREYAKKIGMEFLLLAYSEKNGWERAFF